MINKKASIPLCRSEFLQDVSIELGRRSKALRYREPDLEFSIRERDDQTVDQFSVTSWGRSGGYVQVVVTETKLANYVRRFERQVKGAKAEYLAFQADLTDLDAVEVALFIRDSLFDEPKAMNFWRQRNRQST